MSTTIEPGRYAGEKRSSRGEPAWELALRFPRQGDWTEADYLSLEHQGSLIELVDGCLEFLPMPTLRHQRIVKYLAWLLDQYLRQHHLPGEIGVSPCPIQLWDGRIREPDVFYLRPEHVSEPDEMPTGLELAIEVVSEGADNRQRNLVDKRTDYAQAGVKEDWIVDPENESVAVMALDGNASAIHGEFGKGTTLTSRLSISLSIAVDEIFAAGHGRQTDAR